jgi:hypothetical protein
VAATLRYVKTAERPEAVLTLPDGVDVTAGYTFTLKIGTPGQAALLTKTTNITGGDGQVTIVWTAGELGAVAAGTYGLQLTATTGGLDRVYEGSIAIGDAIT